jgi:hypothetical protein
MSRARLTYLDVPITFEDEGSYVRRSFELPDEVVVFKLQDVIAGPAPGDGVDLQVTALRVGGGANLLADKPLLGEHRQLLRLHDRPVVRKPNVVDVEIEVGSLGLDLRMAEVRFELLSLEVESR